MKFFELLRSRIQQNKETVEAVEVHDEPITAEHIDVTPVTVTTSEMSIEERVVQAAAPHKTLSQIADESGTYPQHVRYYVRKNQLPYQEAVPPRKARTSAVTGVTSHSAKEPEEDTGVSILVIPDAHAKPDVPNDRFLWLGNYIATTRPSIVVCLGDFADMPSLSHYDFNKKSYEGRRYALDIVSVKHAQELLFEGMGTYRPKMIMTLGNHENRINRAIEEDSKLEGTISVDDLEYEKFGWEVHKFKEIAMVEGIAFTHYFPGGLMDKAISGDNVAASILKRYHCSAIQGHRHDLKFASEVHIDGRRITAIVAGCYFQHDEDYVSKTIQKSYWRGLTHLHNVKNGEFDMELIRIEQLQRAYGRDIAA